MFHKIKHTEEQRKIIDACNEYLESESFDPVDPEKIIFKIDLAYTDFNYDDSFSSFHGLFEPEEDISMAIYLDIEELKLYVEFYEMKPDKYVIREIESYTSTEEAINNIAGYSFQELYSCGLGAYDRYMEERYEEEKNSFLKVVGEHFDEMLPLIKAVKSWM